MKRLFPGLVPGLVSGLVSGLFLGLLLAAAARPAAAQTSRAVQDVQGWAEIQAERPLKNGDYLLLAVRGQRDLQVPDYAIDRRRLGFDEQRYTLGYEHFWDDKWSLGGTLRLQATGSRELVLVPELLLRHRSALGPLTFGQRLSLERTLPNNAGYVGGPGPDGQTFARLRVDLEKSLPLGSGRLALRPRLSYEAATHLRFQKDPNAGDERTINFTSLRAEVGLRLSPHVDVTPWFAYQTTYLLTLPQYNANNVQISGGRVNLVSPVLGLETRFTLFRGPAPALPRQLPTQH